MSLPKIIEFYMPTWLTTSNRIIMQTLDYVLILVIIKKSFKYIIIQRNSFMNTLTTIMIRMLTLHILLINITTITMDQPLRPLCQPLHICEIKIDPTLDTACYLSSSLRNLTQNNFGLSSKFPNEPHIRVLISFTPSKQELEHKRKQLAPLIPAKQLDEIISEMAKNEPKPLFIPISHLYNKKAGDIIGCCSDAKFIFPHTNSEACDFYDRLAERIQNFKKQPCCLCSNEQEYQELIDQRIIRMRPNGGTQHGLRGWFTQKHTRSE